MLTTRLARPADDDELARVDAATWSEAVTPSPRPADDAAFFNERTQPENVLVVEDDGAVVGYAKLSRPTPLAAHDHVLAIHGLAVLPDRQRSGAGRRLVEAAIEEARRRGARKLKLGVLSTNPGAQRLYAACGFVVEGVLRDEFFLGGRFVDDLFMARPLIAEQ